MQLIERTHSQTGTRSVSITGLHRCRSKTSCALCARAAAAEAADELMWTCYHALQRGAALLMVTLTVPHTSRDTWTQAIDRAIDGWRSVWSRSSGDELRALGVVGAVRHTEATWSPEHGPHPHHHAIVIVDRPGHAARVARSIVDRWCSAVHGASRAAQRADVVHSVARAAHYVSKLGAEAAYGAWKEAKAGHYAPLQLLAGAEVDPALAHEWQQWQLATKGRRFLGWRDRARLHAWMEAEPVSVAVPIPEELVHDQDEEELLLGISRQLWEAIDEAEEQARLVRIARERERDALRQWQWAQLCELSRITGCGGVGAHIDVDETAELLRRILYARAGPVAGPRAPLALVA